MNYRFAIIIQKHRLLGWVLAPFDTVFEKDKDFYTPVEYLLPDNLFININFNNDLEIISTGSALFEEMLKGTKGILDN